MLKRNAVILTLVIVVLFAFPAQAGLSLNGTSGLIRMPDAFMMGQDNMQAGYFLGGRGHLLTLAYGYNEQVEFGVMYEPPGTFNDIRAQVKLQVTPEDEYWPALAVGTVGSSPYAIASKHILDWAWRAHLGFGWGEFQGPMAGVERVLNPGISITEGTFHFPIITAQAEYIGGGINLGLEAEFHPMLKLHANFLSGPDWNVGIEASHSF